ncbi:hypothetical protein RGR602_PC01167 (plasmid) [Rhizobium gallicum bv. gallicum R602sp]|uniref:Uncharacterized protein n=1 Tax=Rhizobium gallicum bv. gallicum R602sp TaxID=1041138 RepID=A0A0B4XFD8_9HYPH|nr:hypothetical protein RGR602_PC01167 [Rhizobium gallicum bv. gallicum R602sp]
MADVQERDVAAHALRTIFSPTISVSAFEKIKPRPANPAVDKGDCRRNLALLAAYGLRAGNLSLTMPAY